MYILQLLQVCAVALCLAGVGILACTLVLLCLLVKMHRAEQPLSVPIRQSPTLPKIEMPPAPVEAPVERRKLLVKRDSTPVCTQCQRKLKEKPVRGVVTDEGAFLIFKCKCGTETTLADNTPHIPFERLMQ